jgi:hypothetical protein
LDTERLPSPAKDDDVSLLNESENYDQYNSSEDDEMPLLSTTNKPKVPHKRNLSYRVLYDGMNTSKADLEYRRASAPPTSSMTAAERQWLEPQVLKFVGKEKESHDQKPRAAESLEALFQSPEQTKHAATEHNSEKPSASEIAAPSMLKTPPTRIEPSKESMSANSNTLLDDDTVRTNFLNFP